MPSERVAHNYAENSLFSLLIPPSAAPVVFLIRAEYTIGVLLFYLVACVRSGKNVCVRLAI